MLVWDIETDGLLDNVERVHCIHLFDRSTGRPYRFTDNEYYQDLDGNLTTTKCPRSGTLQDGLKMLAEAECVGGHNIIEYDIPALQIVFPDWQLRGDCIVRDTKVESKLLYPDLKDRDFAAIRKGKLPLSFQKKGLIGTHKLESWGLRIGEQLKEEFNPRDFGHTWKTMPFTQVFDNYGAQDVVANVHIFEYFENQKFFKADPVAIENRVAAIIDEQTRNGVHFNVEEAEKLQAKLEPIRAGLAEECRMVFHPWFVPDGKTQDYTYVCDNEPKHLMGRGLFVPKRNNGPQGYTAGVPFTKVKLVVFNPASRDHIASRLTSLYGWEPVDFTDSGKPKVDETVLGELPYPEAKKLAEFFTVNKRLGQLSEGKQAWLKKVTPEGKIHGRIDTLGAVTNRMTHSNPNLAQVPKVGSPYGAECRALFGPRPGFVQVGCDADGLEGRCLGHYLARFDGGAYITRLLEGDKAIGTDEHSMNQKAVGLNARDAAKTIFYAFAYGAGDFKLGSIYVNDMAEAKREQFYAKYPAGPARRSAIVRLGKRSRARLVEGIVGMGPLLEAIKKSASSGWIRAIDGRRLRVRSQHAALNTLLQGMGALVMKWALVIADEALRGAYTIGEDFHYLLNVHDEFQLECRPELADSVGQILADSISEAGRQLESRCELTGSFDVGATWKDTH